MHVMPCMCVCLCVCEACLARDALQPMLCNRCSIPPVPTPESMALPHNQLLCHSAAFALKYQKKEKNELFVVSKSRHAHWDLDKSCDT